MTDITLTHLEPALTERLQHRASANGRAVEAESPLSWRAF